MVEDHCEVCGESSEFPTAQMKTWGPYAWGILHQTVETMPCPHCREKGTAGLRAMHDLANYNLGHPLFDKDNFLAVSDVYTKVAEEVRKAPAVVEQTGKPAHIAAVSRVLHAHSPHKISTGDMGIMGTGHRGPQPYVGGEDAGVESAQPHTSASTARKGPLGVLPLGPLRRALRGRKLDLNGSR